MTRCVSGPAAPQSVSDWPGRSVVGRIHALMPDPDPRNVRAVALAARLGLTQESTHFEQALTHPSFAHEHDAPHNQRLEFLGDAVLGFCASEELYRRFPHADEGTLTRLRSQLVNAQALATWARTLQVPELLRLGRGAGSSGLRESTNVVADAVEALIAAAYLDAGLDAARRICSVIIDFHLSSLEPVQRDPKSELQERIQARGGQTPRYEVVEATGPAHDRRFRVRVLVQGEALALGEGKSRRSAERAAAQEALSALAAPSDDAAATDGDVDDA